MSEPEEFTFAPSTDGAADRSSDPGLALMASCIVNQQRAGFRNRIDIRQFSCPSCGRAGFNTGWGAVAFICGAEIVGDEMAVPCPKEKVPA